MTCQFDKRLYSVIVLIFFKLFYINSIDFNSAFNRPVNQKSTPIITIYSSFRLPLITIFLYNLLLHHFICHEYSSHSLVLYLIRLALGHILMKVILLMF